MKKNISSFLIFIFLLFNSSFSQAEIKKLPRDFLTYLHSDIDRAILTVDPNVHVGIEIISLKNGQKIYEKNAQQLFIPGSSLKLVMAAAALDILGINYCFITQFYTNGAIKGKILEGDLYLKGTGDPSFSIDDLEELVFHLRLLQVEEIRGNLIIDNFEFDGVAQGPGWMWDEGLEYGNSSMDALNINHNCVNLWIKPSDQISQPPQVYIYPRTDYITIENSALTVQQQSKLSVERVSFTKQNVIEVKGCVNKEACCKEYAIPVAAPQLFSGHILKDLLIKHGIRFKGEILNKKLPEKATLLAVHRSLPLSQTLYEMMKSSDNLYANCLFKKVGQNRFGNPGSWKTGSQAVRDFLEKRVGLDLSNMVLLDGCGQSRYNLISPRQMVAFLKWAHDQFTFSPEFLSSLPISGIDGTLRERMGTNDKGKIRAETGTMTGISSICGFATTKDGEPLAFAIFLNGFVKPSYQYKCSLEDQICSLLAGFSRNPESL